MSCQPSRQTQSKIPLAQNSVNQIFGGTDTHQIARFIFGKFRGRYPKRHSFLPLFRHGQTPDRKPGKSKELTNSADFVLRSGKYRLARFQIALFIIGFRIDAALQPAWCDPWIGFIFIIFGFAHSSKAIIMSAPKFS